MKNLLLISICIFSLNLKAQEQTIKITDLELPNAPAFTILDQTPTNISSPTTTQALTLSLINASTSANGLPTNYALEFTPYWIFAKQGRSMLDYIDSEEEMAFCKPYKNLSFSVATVKKDTIQNLSIGIRTNLLTINRKDRKKDLAALKIDLESFNYILDNKLNLEKNPFQAGTEEFKEYQKAELNGLTGDAKYQQITEDIYDKRDALSISKPVFTIDIATAYNHFFDSNEYKSGKFGRYGVWSTLTGNFKFNKNKNNYLSIYQYTRFLNNEMNFDIATNTYLKEKNLDIGAKIDLQFNDFTFGYEYIKRTNQQNNYRSVGNLKYKINNKVTLNGGFGKNFEKTDNLVSFLGVSWGISSNDEVNLENSKK